MNNATPTAAVIRTPNPGRISPAEREAIALRAAAYVCREGYGPDDAGRAVNLTSDARDALNRWYADWSADRETGLPESYLRTVPAVQPSDVLFAGMTPTQNTDADIAAWLEAVRVNVLVPHEAPEKRPTPYTSLEIDTGRVFRRIIAVHGGQRSCWAFVALADGYSRTMGAYRRGDVFKPDGFKKPARHARGNIYDPNPTHGVQWTGPCTLR